MLDIKKSRAEADLDNEPAEVILLDRNDEPYTDEQGNPSIFLVLGEYSDKIRAYDRAQTNKNLKRRAKDEEETYDTITARVVDRLAAAVVGWKNIASDGEPAQFSTAGVKEILTTMEWTRGRVADGMVKHASFFAKRSAA